jgi:hypothetical protein
MFDAGMFIVEVRLKLFKNILPIFRRGPRKAA